MMKSNIGNRMLALASLITCFLAGLNATAGGTLRLGWDAAVDAPAGVIYTLYASTNVFTSAIPTNSVRTTVGTNLTVTLERLVPGRWWFAVTANKDGMESEPSNVLLAESPRAPSNLRPIVPPMTPFPTNLIVTGYFDVRTP